MSYNDDLKKHSQELRKGATKEERHLWYDFLRTHPVQFNRQKIIGNYIVDFYCDSAKLVIELDGSQHYEIDAIQYDTERTMYLGSLGMKVLRFNNMDIRKNFEDVCMAIDSAVKERMGQ